MSASQDYVALDWIKGEIGQTLNQAKDALEAVAESPDDATRMRPCLTALHQVHGTLKMVELAGPTTLASEMEQLAQALMSGNVPEVAEAQEALMRSILQMPPYLDKIQREQADPESNYLPIVNSLRSARGEELIVGEEPVPEAGVDYSRIESAPDASVAKAYEKAKGPQTVQKLRARFQQSLVAITKKDSIRENVAMLGKVFSNLAKLCGDSPSGAMSQVALGLVEGIGGGAIKLSGTALNPLKAVDAELKRLATGGADAFAAPVDRGLIESMFD